jgi:uncharacterized protein DUF6084
MDLGFEVVDCRPEPYAVAPTLMAKIRVTESSGEHIHAIATKCQIRVEPHRRRYSEGEEERLSELFGEPKRWGDTLKGFLWTHVSFMVPSFRDRVEIEVPIQCTYDFEVAASKYFQALDSEGDGVIPLIFLFNGTVFSKGAAGSPTGFAVGHVPWDREAPYRLPVSAWRAVMDLYFPNTAWVRLPRDTFNALYLFKARHGLPTWEEAVGLLLEKAGDGDLVARSDPAERNVWPKPPAAASAANGAGRAGEAPRVGEPGEGAASSGVAEAGGGSTGVAVPGAQGSPEEDAP